MEVTLSPTEVNKLLQEEEGSDRGLSEKKLEAETDKLEVTPSHIKKNAYPAVRHILIVTCVLFALSLIIFLIHQNGKSIYDNGL